MRFMGKQAAVTSTGGAVGLALGGIMSTQNKWRTSTVALAARGRAAGVLIASVFAGQFASPAFASLASLTLSLPGVFLSFAAFDALTRHALPRHQTLKRPLPAASRDVLLIFGGGATRDRTADLLHAMQPLSHLSYSPTGRRRIESARHAVNHPSKAET